MACRRAVSLVSLAAFCTDGRRARMAEIHAIESSDTTSWPGLTVHNPHLAFDHDRWPQSLASEVSKEAGVDLFVTVFKSGTTQKEVESACSTFSCAFHSHATGFKFMLVEATSDKLRELGHSTHVKFAEPLQHFKAFGDSGETATNGEEDGLWGLKRIRSRSIDDQPREDTGPAHGGEGVSVYVMDTGVRVTHNDFGGRAIPGAEVKLFSGEIRTCEPGSDNFWTGWNCAKDRQSHGTHCSGTIAGAKNGVAKAATIYAVKVLNDFGSGSTAGIVNGMDWVATNQVKPAVASMSLGGGKSEALNEAVTAMVDAGVTVVTASGNENTDACTKSPGSSPSSINVGATNRTDVRASFSNYGECLTIWAPGQDILSSVSSSDTAEKVYSGTSMACPHVSGAAAIILSYHKTLTPADVKQLLVGSATNDTISDIKDGSPGYFLYSLA